MEKKNSVDQAFVDAIISDFLERNPGMKKEDVFVQTVGGKLIVRSIKQAFVSVSKHVQKKPVIPPEYQKFLDEVARSGADRYDVCLASIDSAKTYIGWMSLPRYTSYSEEESRKHLAVLDALGRKCEEMAKAQSDLKDRFSESINGGIRPSPSLIKTWVQEYMQAVLDQLKCQRSIFTNELSAGNQFTNCVRSYMSDSIPHDAGKPDPQFIKALAKVVIILRNEGIEAPDVHSVSDVKELDKALSGFYKKLKNRRKTLEELNHLIAHIEVFVEQMQPPSSQSGQETEEKKPKHRMVFRKNKQTK